MYVLRVTCCACCVLHNYGSGCPQAEQPWCSRTSQRAATMHAQADAGLIPEAELPDAQTLGQQQFPEGIRAQSTSGDHQPGGPAAPTPHSRRRLCAAHMHHITAALDANPQSSRHANVQALRLDRDDWQIEMSSITWPGPRESKNSSSIQPNIFQSSHSGYKPSARTLWN